MIYNRAHIRLNTTREANDFVKAINSDGTVNRYTIEDFDCVQRVNARSLLGVIYALTEFNDDMYFVNETDNGAIPSCIDIYRV